MTKKRTRKTVSRAASKKKKVSAAKKIAAGSRTRKKAVKKKTPKSKKRRRRKTSAKKKTASPALDTPFDDVEPLRPAAGEVVVRMYRQGLGDCFLLAFGTDDRADPRYVLIDCGIHMRQRQGKDRLMHVMQHLQAATDNHIHVVVATHEHADHLSGFVQKGSPFFKKSLTIGQLWVAWTEKFGDPDADRLRKEKASARDLIDRAVEEAIKKNNPQMAAFAEQLKGLMDFETPQEDSFDDDERDAVMSIIEQQADDADRKSRLQEFLAKFVEDDDVGLASAPKRKKKLTSNELALGLLAAKAEIVCYCDPGDVLTVPDVDGVRAYTMGPPRDNLFLKKDLPSKVRGGHDHEYKETYLSGSVELQALKLAPALRASDDNDCAADQQHPFAYDYRRRVADDDEHECDDRSHLWGERLKWDESTQEFFEKHYFDPENQWRSIEGEWLAPAEQLALKLDSDTNNTSLALAFELGPPGSGQVLLFPGDAQVGNWLSWREQSYSAGGQTVSVDDLFQRTLVYKVGHHGSHNATLKNYVRPKSKEDGEPYGLELMDDIISLIPVDRDAADRPMPTPWRMPHRPLYERLRSKSDRRVLRADLSKKPLSNSADDDVYPDSPDWTAVPGKPGLSWRRSDETLNFSDELGTEGPLYYDIRIPVADGE